MDNRRLINNFRQNRNTVVMCLRGPKFSNILSPTFLRVPVWEHIETSETTPIPPFGNKL